MLFFMILKNQEFDIRSSLQIIFSDHADTDTVTTRSDVAGNAERKRIIVDSLQMLSLLDTPLK